MQEQMPKKPNNLRTGLILASVALIFFAGVFVKHIWFN
ncbi:MAG TPA: cytochrome oxidase small assembly protein [Burkholderiaceae bacterium]|nr:cytochrome oxidase small assembly protein [Burkholderiaceae bacterium]